MSAYGYSMVRDPDRHFQLVVGSDYLDDRKGGTDWLYRQGAIPIDHPDVFPPPPEERLARSPHGVVGIPSYKFAYPGPWRILPEEIDVTLDIVGAQAAVAPLETQVLVAYLRLSIHHGGATRGPLPGAPLASREVVEVARRSPDGVGHRVILGETCESTHWKEPTR